MENKENYLVIVESMTKGKTISGFLDRNYSVLACYGHIRDLPKSYGLKEMEKDDFNPRYEIIGDKRKTIAELKRYINKDTIVYLASDEDREGEAIAWHLIPALGIDKSRTKRIAFHEITKPAILHALAHPRDVDINMVNAQQARRILDRGVGYGLSPLLWSKIKKGLSAGRVQSAGLKLIVDRENERRLFIPEESWKFKANFINPMFKAELTKENNKAINIKNIDEANNVEALLKGYPYVLTNIEEKDGFRTPTAPYTTSTLQQEASRKLGMPIKKIMEVAQQLYEGNIQNKIPNHEGGLITYMRTDSVTLSDIALGNIKSLLLRDYGNEYTLANPRIFKNKTVGAQEAHEAIRPTNVYLRPKDIEQYLNPQQFKLYRLIWEKTMATQMPSAKVANTIYKITAGKDKQFEFTAKGNRMVFPGFLKVMSEDKDDVILPNIPLNTILNLDTLEKEQVFSNPPTQYTEASFVKALEALGIGRPSTYASTISTLQTRSYVEIIDKKLVPTAIGEMVNKFLVNNFPEIVCAEFTANIEKQLDEIASGNLDWHSMIKTFCLDLMKRISSKKDNVERSEYSKVKDIGINPSTNLMMSIFINKYGPHIRMGDKEKGEAVKYAMIPKGINANDIDVPMALKLLALPRILGKYKDFDVKVSIGGYGPYIQLDKKYYSLKEDLFTLTLERAIEIIDEIDNRPKYEKAEGDDKPKFKKKFKKWKK